jgi:hypothetical protein
MPGRLSRGWSMARASGSVLRANPQLAVFPVISGAILLAAMGAIALSLLPQAGRGRGASQGIWSWMGSDATGQVWFYAGAFAVIYALTAIALFCNAALIHCALACHRGETPSVGDGFAAALARLPQILGWALIAATVGVALNTLESALRNNLGILGSLLGGLFEFAWAAVTYLVMPVLIVEKVGPITAIRRSTALLRARWGESLAGATRFGLLGMLFGMVAALVFCGGFALMLSQGTSVGVGLGGLLIALGVLGGVATIVVFQTLSAIFQAGVYIYASTGQVPASLNAALIEATFRRKS